MGVPPFKETPISNLLRLAFLKGPQSSCTNQKGSNIKNGLYGFVCQTLVDFFKKSFGVFWLPSQTVSDSVEFWVKFPLNILLGFHTQPPKAWIFGILSSQDASGPSNM